MKRKIVKAWVWRWTASGGVYVGSVRRIKRDVEVFPKEMGRVVPCTITYDDGKKPKRKKP